MSKDASKTLGGSSDARLAARSDHQFGASPLPGASGPPTDLLGLGQLQVTPQDQNTDQGAALGQTYQMITDAIARLREQSRQMGLLGDDGLPTQGWPQRGGRQGYR